MKFCRNVLQVNSHRLTESDFRFDVTHSRRRPWRRFTAKRAATWWVNTKRLLPGAYAVAYHQFLIYRIDNSRSYCTTVRSANQPISGQIVLNMHAMVKFGFKIFTRYCAITTLQALFWNILGAPCFGYFFAFTVSASLLSLQPRSGDNALTLVSFGDVMEQSAPLTSSKQK